MGMFVFGAAEVEFLKIFLFNKKGMFVSGAAMFESVRGIIAVQ